jgi:hypothetical protein
MNVRSLRLTKFHVGLLIVAVLAIARGIWLFRFRAAPFTPTDVLFCLLAIPIGFLLLLASDYMFHHARFAFILLALLLVFLVLTVPGFAVGLGGALFLLVLTA